jgi:hypothetical protein
MNTYALNTWLHNGRGNFFQNVFHYSVDDSALNDPFKSARDLCDAWATGLKAKYLAMFGMDVRLDFLSARKVSTGGGPSATKIMGDAGAQLVESISTALAADIVWIVNAATHRFARSFIGGFSIDSILQDVWTPAFSGEVALFIAEMLKPLAVGATNAIFGLFSRKTQNFSPATDGQLRLKPTGMNKRTTPII